MARDPGTGAKNIFRTQDVDPIQAGLAANYEKQKNAPHSSLGELAKKAIDYSVFPLLGVPATGTTVGRAIQGKQSFGSIVTDPFKDKPGQVSAQTPFVGPIRAGAGLLEDAPRATARPHNARTLKVNDLEQQVPRARSRITQNAIEKPADKVSNRLQQSERAKAIPGVRLATTQERVVKAAGRAQRVAPGRAAARQAKHLDAIKAIKPGSASDVANFWYAQLPKTHRNATGLSLIRGKQAETLDGLTSGRTLDALNAQENAVNAALKNAPADERYKLLKHKEDLQKFKSDIPRQIEDVSASLAELDNVIAAAPKPNSAAISAVQALSNDREQILVAAGKIEDDNVFGRKGLVSQWLGLTPSGDEAYIGHRLPRPKNSRFPFTPAGGTGRVKSPQGVGTANNLILAGNGRLRASTHVAVEDWRAAQVFKTATRSRDELSKVGTPFAGHVPEDAVLVNPKGRAIPPHWKNDQFAHLADTYDDVDAIRKQAQEIVDGFAADGSDIDAVERMKQQALNDGVSWDELRVVPKRLVDRYYAQFRPSAGRGKALNAYDTAVDVMAFSIVSARLGFIPKNLVQAVIQAVPLQGALLPRNAVWAAQVARDPELLAFVKGEIGHGASATIGEEAFHKKVISAPAKIGGLLADDPVRMTAFMHELSAANVIRRKVGLLDERDMAAIRRLFTDESQRPLLDDISSRAVNAMGDFTRMTPDQARVARRFLIVPGWLMAGTRLPFHFAATHPIRSALIAYMAMGEPGAPDGLDFNKPINQYLHGEGYKRGFDTPLGRVRTSAIDPVSTPWEIGGAVVQTARGKTNPFDYNQRTVFDMAQPLLSAGVGIAKGEGVARNVERLFPDYGLARDLISPDQNDPNYPEDATRLGRLKREVGVAPIRVNDSKPKKRSSNGGSGNIFSHSGSSSSGGGNIFR